MCVTYTKDDSLFTSSDFLKSLPKFNSKCQIDLIQGTLYLIVLQCTMLLCMMCLLSANSYDLLCIVAYCTKGLRLLTIVQQARTCRSLAQHGLYILYYDAIPMNNTGYLQ